MCSSVLSLCCLPPAIGCLLAICTHSCNVFRPQEPSSHRNEPLLLGHALVAGEGRTVRSSTWMLSWKSAKLDVTPLDLYTSTCLGLASSHSPLLHPPPALILEQLPASIMARSMPSATHRAQVNTELINQLSENRCTRKRRHFLRMALAHPQGRAWRAYVPPHTCLCM